MPVPMRTRWRTVRQPPSRNNEPAFEWGLDEGEGIRSLKRPSFCALHPHVLLAGRPTGTCVPLCGRIHDLCTLSFSNRKPVVVLSCNEAGMKGSIPCSRARRSPYV